MIPGSFASPGGNNPRLRSSVTRQPSDSRGVHRGFSSPLEAGLMEQLNLSDQTPYERRASQLGHYDTGLLLGQSDFKATLKQPFAVKFASRKAHSEELRPAQSREAPPRSKIPKFLRWNTNQADKKSNGSGMGERVETPPSEPPPSGAANHGSG